ncbi:MAG: hypothetical protein CMH82_06290 [Nocardioides sp.]|nr:hypothetical protein [Nocardioides sp.]
MVTVRSRCPDAWWRRGLGVSDCRCCLVESDHGSTGRSSGPLDGEHLVHRGVAVLSRALTDLDEVSLIGLDQTATAASLVEIAAAEARLGELKHRVLAHASQVRVEEATGAATTATWLARATRTTVRTSRRAVHLATALETYERLREGYAAGAVNTEQTEVIARALDALPTDLPATVKAAAEQRLVDLAAHHDACDLRVLGDRVLDVGRRKRLFTRAQRIALATRDKGCTATGYHTAAWFCHAHHDQPRATGGTTDLTNGRLLCPTHHRTAHDPRYDTRVLADHQIEFTLRC